MEIIRSSVCQCNDKDYQNINEMKPDRVPGGKKVTKEMSIGTSSTEEEHIQAGYKVNSP